MTTILKNTTLTLAPARKEAKVLFKQITSPVITKDAVQHQADPIMETLAEVMTEHLYNMVTGDGECLPKHTGVKVVAGKHSLKIVIPGEKRTVFKNGQPVKNNDGSVRYERVMGLELSLINTATAAPVGKQIYDQHMLLLKRLSASLPFVYQMVQDSLNKGAQWGIETEARLKAKASA